MPLERTSLLEYAERNAYRLSQRTPLPLYYQLFRLCERYICEHHISPGEQFPSEKEIAVSFDVSRPTAHHAIQELLNRGWLRRERGRGTFITEGACADLTLAAEGLTFSDRYLGGGQVRTRALDLGEQTPSDHLKEALRLREGDRVMHLRRLRSVDGRPFLLCDSWFSTSRFPAFTMGALAEGSLAAAFRRGYNTRITRCERRIEAGEALAEEVADLLEIPLLSPILVVHGLAYGERDDPVIVTQSYGREGVALLSVAHPSDGQRSPIAPL